MKMDFFKIYNFVNVNKINIYIINLRNFYKKNKINLISNIDIYFFNKIFI